MDNLANTFSSKQVLHFYMQEVLACIPLQYIEKVLPLVQLEWVPGSPDYVVGVINFFGESIPVIDLAWRMGMEKNAPYSLRTPIILCSYSKKRLALVVENIIGIASADKQDLKNEFDKEDSFFVATIHYDLKLSLLIDIEKIFSVSL